MKSIHLPCPRQTASAKSAVSVTSFAFVRRSLFATSALPVFFPHRCRRQMCSSHPKLDYLAIIMCTATTARLVSRSAHASNGPTVNLRQNHPLFKRSRLLLTAKQIECSDVTRKCVIQYDFYTGKAVQIGPLISESRLGRLDPQENWRLVRVRLTHRPLRTLSDLPVATQCLSRRPVKDCAFHCFPYAVIQWSQDRQYGTTPMQRIYYYYSWTSLICCVTRWSTH